MANPRIEEVDDVSDPEEVDLEEAFDFARPGQNTLAPASDPSQSRLDPDVMQQMLASQSGANPQMNEKERLQRERQATESAKQYQCLYPVYFDASRSREEGRRVKMEDAVDCPLAREIVEALQYIGDSQNIPFRVVFEPHKSHPKDWANPGRIRVLVKKDGKAVDRKVKNKHHLYKLVADYLKAHPTNENSPMKMQMRGLPPQKEKIPPPAVPRGFKISSILPLHSPALSGGGVSDNMMQDMMKELQNAGGGQGMPSLPAGLSNMMGGGGAGGGAGGGGAVQKKDKKKR
nr:hypothetical protein B0A51_05632 [Rachicladosporium sp. CCFEE 5018]